MKKLLMVLATCFMFGTANQAQAFDLKGLLSGVAEAATQTSEFEIASLEGSWAYSSPAVDLESEDVLSQIGGTAVNAAIEEKLSTYYNRFGLNNLKVTFDAEGNFVAEFKGIPLAGVVSRQEDGSLVFNFTPLGSFTIGKIAAKAKMNGNNIVTLTFDASKLVNAVKKIASYSNEATMQALISVVDSYQGIYLGAEFQRQQ